MKYDIILEKLRDLPIFKLSLGSKELFHSNFLEYLWEVDHRLFLNIINRLLPKGEYLLEDGYELSRELENFDLCLYHNSKSPIYDLIIENKVKSIPFKEQLKEYKVKAEKSLTPPHFLLLSLVENFPDCEELEKVENYKEYGHWHIVHYNQLREAIEQEKELWPTTKDRTYIEDYCTFIDLLHQLQQEILKDIETQPLFVDVETFKRYRLHDLYIKLRISYFLIKLKQRLEAEQVGSVSFLKNHGDIRGKYKEPGIYLNQNIFRSVGQLAAFIYKSHDDKGDIHEIVIQGDQYRHGINSQERGNKGKEKVDSQNRLWESIQQRPSELDFLNNIFSGVETLPKTAKTSKKVQKVGPFNGYNHDYVYRYVKCDKMTVNELLDIMATDVKQKFEK